MAQKEIPSNSNSSHSPTLNSIQMVEQVLDEIGGFDSKSKLHRSLPRTMQYPTFNKILDYLEESNKITFDKKGAVVWIHTSDIQMKKIRKESIQLR